MKNTKRYSPEVRERAVRMVFEHEREHDSQWASIAAKTGCTTETLPSDWCVYRPLSAPEYPSLFQSFDLFFCESRLN